MITTTTYYTGDLQIGDLVAVAENSYICLGFFAGRGINDSFQYWSFWSLAEWFDDVYNVRTRGHKPRKSYHNAASPHRVIKLTPEFFDNVTMEKYEKSIEALKLLKVISDFETNVLKSK